MRMSSEWTIEERQYFLLGYCYRRAEEGYPNESPEVKNAIANRYLAEAIEQHVGETQK